MRRLATRVTSISRRSSAISGSRAPKQSSCSPIIHRFGSFSRASTTVRSRFTGPVVKMRAAVTRFRPHRRRRPSIRQCASFSTTAFAARTHSWRGSSVKARERGEIAASGRPCRLGADRDRDFAHHRRSLSRRGVAQTAQGAGRRRHRFDLRAGTSVRQSCVEAGHEPSGNRMTTHTDQLIELFPALL